MNRTMIGLANSNQDYPEMVAHVVVSSQRGQLELDRLCRKLRNHLYIDFIQTKYSFDKEQSPVRHLL